MGRKGWHFAFICIYALLYITGNLKWCLYICLSTWRSQDHNVCSLNQTKLYRSVDVITFPQSAIKVVCCRHLLKLLNVRDYALDFSKEVPWVFVCFPSQYRPNVVPAFAACVSAHSG